MNTDPANPNFDLFRLCKSKTAVDLSTNTLRAYNKQGLPFYFMGNVVFISKTELEKFIRERSTSAKVLKVGTAA